VLPRAECDHALRVRRLDSGAPVIVIDGTGTVAACRLRAESDRRAVAVIDDVRREPWARPEIVVYQGAAKGHKTDDAIDRLAQLGAAEVRVFSSQRSVVRWDESKRRALERRWQATARAAAKQSRRPFVAATGPLLSWSEVVEAVRAERHALVLWEEADVPLRALLSDVFRIAIVVGPEGGFTTGEARALAEAGGRLVSLGPGILRTENAALVAASAILYHFGRIG
jgi:16S rRNA (uracil1498-N3)-methyltransferase